eukprot:3078333-Alexandrium_andersonii.AAC.1
MPQFVALETKTQAALSAAPGFATVRRVEPHPLGVLARGGLRWQHSKLGLALQRPACRGPHH